MICVTKWSSILAEDEGLELHSPEWYELMLACMFHDMNHSEGKLPDIENVNNAIDEFCEFYAVEYSTMEANLIGEDTVNKIIRATQYPYMIADEDLNQCQMIIRDADLLIALEPDWFQNAFLGLMKEMDFFEVRNMIAGQKEFHHSIQMRTQSGKDLYTDLWPTQIFRTIELLEKVYES
jgi:hypothetical protein